MNLRRSIWKIFALSIMLLLMIGFCVAHAEISTGIDLVILLDSSYSMSGYKGSDATDKLYERCDAATMMINMCDAKESYAAVIPFTDHVIEGNMFCKMLDMSDLNVRNRLCDSVLERDTTSAPSNTTKFGDALNLAYRLFEQRRNAGSQNRCVVLLLSDGDAEDKDKSRAEVE